MSEKLIDRAETIQRLGSEWTYDQLRQAGKLRPAAYQPGRNGRRPFYSPRQVESLLKERERKQARPPGDLLTIVEAIAEFGHTKKTYLRWVNAGCPALGRKLGHTRKRGAYYLSRADLLRLGELHHSIEGVPCPGNTGTWKDSQVYANHDGRLYVTLPHIEDNYEIDKGLFRIWIGNKAAPDGGQLRLLRPRRPSAKNPHGGRIWVVALEDVERLRDWRASTPLEVLQIDHEEWATNTTLRERFGAQGFREQSPCLWAKQGVSVRSRKGHLPRLGKGGRSSVTFYCIKDVAAALGLEPQKKPATVNDELPRPVEDTPKQKRGGRPVSLKTTEVYKFCYEAYSRGDKLAKAMLEAQRLFGQTAPKHPSEVSRNASRYAKRHGLPLNRPG